MAKVGDLLLGGLGQWVLAAADNLNKEERRGEEGGGEGHQSQVNIRMSKHVLSVLAIVVHKQLPLPSSRVCRTHIKH